MVWRYGFYAIKQQYCCALKLHVRTECVYARDTKETEFKAKDQQHIAHTKKNSQTTNAKRHILNGEGWKH